MPKKPVDSPTHKRKPFSKRQRFDIFKRDNFTCQYCGATPPKVVLEVDHIVAIAEGGSHDETNWITACFGCNRGKGARDLKITPQSLADKAAEIREREEQLAGFVEIVEAQRLRIDDDAWAVMAALKDTSIDEVRAFPPQIRSIKTFMKRGLTRPDLMEAAELAQRSRGDQFRYFCGICWNKIRELDGNG